MIKAKSIIPLLVGLGVGFYAVKLGVNMVKKAQGAARGGQSVKVVVTVSETPVGTQLTANMLKLAEVPQALAPPSTFNDLEQVIGRVASHSLLPGACVSEQVLAPPGTPPGLNVRIPRGYRAVAVKVDEYSSVAGFLKPGSHVDVIAVLTQRQGSRRDTVSRTILENLEVAAVGQQMADAKDPGATVTRSVTLLVKPKDAALLHLADTKGRIRLALRQQRDGKRGQPGFASTKDLLDERTHLVQSKPETGWWRGLAAGLASRMAEKAAQNPLGKGVQALPLRVASVLEPPKPWVVTVISGSETRKLLFESPLSTRRIGPAEAASGGLLNSRPGMSRYSDLSGEQRHRAGSPPAGESRDSQRTSPPDD